MPINDFLGEGQTLFSLFFSIYFLLRKFTSTCGVVTTLAFQAARPN